MLTGPQSAWLEALLKRVSRSFFLTLHVLPTRVRSQIGLAYLLARASDTIADTDCLPVGERLHALQAFAARVSGSDPSPLNLVPLTQAQGDEAEHALLSQIDRAIALLNSTAPPDRASIQSVLHTIISGQTLDLQRFSAASKSHVVALNSSDDLHDYTYRVAGCVGEFWTEICLRHLTPQFSGNSSQLLENGVRFGKGLQLVNILRDLPKDLAQGRCYLPADALLKHGLQPTDLLNPASAAKLDPLFRVWHTHAFHHLHAGWDYTLALPRPWIRVRLACAWPVLIGFKTLDLLSSGPNLEPHKRPKVSRPEIRKILLKSLFALPFASSWKNLAPSTSHPSSNTPTHPSR